MSIEVVCNCGRTLRAKPELAGKHVRCPQCKRPVLVEMLDQLDELDELEEFQPEADECVETELDPYEPAAAWNAPSPPTPPMPLPPSLHYPQLAAPAAGFTGSPRLGGYSHHPRQQGSGGTLWVTVIIGGGIAALVLATIVGSMLLKGDDSNEADRNELARLEEQASLRPEQDNAARQSSIAPQSSAGPMPSQGPARAAQGSSNFEPFELPKPTTIVPGQSDAFSNDVGDAGSAPSGGGATTSLPKPPPSEPSLGTPPNLQQDQHTWENLGLTLHLRQQGGTALQGATSLKDEPVIGNYSWMVELLPFLDQQALYDKFNRSQSWSHQDNLKHTQSIVPEFLNPADRRQQWQGYPFQGMGMSHFVGISGLEEARNDVAATLPRDDPRAGVFGYGEIVPPERIADGAGQTLMIIGSGELAAPWVQGGGATVRGAREPYFDEISGFGSRGLSSAGAKAVFADGSVRNLSKNISPKVFRALVTTHGAETIDREDLAPQTTAP